MSYNACQPPARDILSSDATRGGNPFEVKGRILKYSLARSHIGCFTRYSYYDVDGNFIEQTIPEPRVITFDPNGTNLGELIVPDKTISNFKLIFEPGCSSPDIPNHIALIIRKVTEDIYNPHYTQFNFAGYYNKVTMNKADITFNFQNFIEYFERLQTPEEVPLYNVVGSFGPTTIARFASHAATDIHRGCLTNIGVVRTTGNYQLAIFPKVISFTSASDIGELGLVPGEYSYITLIFDKWACGSSILPNGVSYQVTNQHGTFNKDDAQASFSLSFASETAVGFRVPDDRDKGVDFNINTLLERFENVSSQSEFAQALPVVSDVVGTFKVGN